MLFKSGKEYDIIVSCIKLFCLKQQKGRMAYILLNLYVHVTEDEKVKAVGKIEKALKAV